MRVVACVVLASLSAFSKAASGGAKGATASPAPAQFDRDIRPILSENCFYCHGQDPNHREADLRLDSADQATRDLGGYAAIVPGRPRDSEVIRRLTSPDRAEVMPPPKSNKRLSPEQIELLRRWIAEGAVYQKHWAFETPRQPALPSVRQTSWPKSPIDRFVLARLESEGLKPSAEASPEKWLRRVSFDLVGLPPTPAEIDAFAADVRDRGEAAYEAAADRLLASEHFGERQAIDWLDAARYADTHGFNNDSARQMWRWRDWVIDAFNANKPYDRFILEQLAGDLLPNATVEQKLATGFCRNHVINSEGGIIGEEYRVEYVADRVRTLSMAWLGLTAECSRCHDHKFDPLTQKDYYGLYAFFNNVAEFGEDGRVANAVPLMSAPTAAQQKERTDRQFALEQARSQLKPFRDAYRWTKSDRCECEAIDPALPPAAATVDCETIGGREKLWSMTGGHATAVAGISGQAWQGDGRDAFATLDRSAFPTDSKTGATASFWFRSDHDSPEDLPIFSGLNRKGSAADAQFGKGSELRLEGRELVFNLSGRFPVYAARLKTDGADIRRGQWRHVAIVLETQPAEAKRYPVSSIRLYVDGSQVRTTALNDGLADLPAAQPLLLGGDNGPADRRWKGAIDQWHSFSAPLSSQEVRSLFESEAVPYADERMAAEAATETEKSWLREASLGTDVRAQSELAKERELWDQLLAFERSLPTAMVMQEMPQPRQAHVLVRGNYDMPGDAVEPSVPERLLVAWPEGAPRNRMGLAQWLIRPDHPLTARVVVNRWWAQLFGTGIVKTLEDFGYQGEYPSHPELLDYLARQFVDGGWNSKAFFRAVVLSSTYRQGSDVSASLAERDPENRLLARGPRVRLPAELIRDQALSASGLLHERLGGPSVFPYQPADLYNGIVVGADYPGTTWTQSHGDDLHRRSLYTFWKRTVPHPAMLTFDAPDREFCSVRRSRTNTPLQALTLLNETGFLEAARALGERMLLEGGDADAARMAFGFRLATGRAPVEAESQILVRTFQRFRSDFLNDAASATAMLAVGEAPSSSTLAARASVADRAAASVVATMILNLDEAVTKN